MLPNAIQRTIRVPVQVKAEVVIRADGLKLPTLKDDCSLELLIPLEAFTDPKELAEYLVEDLRIIAGAGTELLFGLSPNTIPMEKVDDLLRHPKQPFFTLYALLPVVLQDDLMLRVQPGKAARLEKCKCVLPTIKKEASSVNHAFTLASEYYETRRISHTANVFDRVWVKTPDSWKRLDKLRHETCAGK